MSIHRFRKELERLEKAMRPEFEDEAERHRRLKMVREGAEQLNDSFYRDLARERRRVFLESVGFEGHTVEDLREANFLYPGDEPPFIIEEDGAVRSTRDGKPITDYAQTLAEVWYWQEAYRGSCTSSTTRRPRRSAPPRGTLPSRGSGWTSGTCSLP